MNKIDTWEELYVKTEKLSKPSSIHNLLTKKEVVELEKAVIRILNNFLDKGELHKGIKVYVDKVLRHDIVGRMQKTRPLETETLEKWCTKIFGEEKFGVVFNSLELYDNTIGELMCSTVAPLIKRAGLPLGGLSFLFFMGNYGFTPFGIHKEAKGEEGFLFHLGPEKKEFYTWDIEELNSIEHNTKVFHDELEEMLPASEEYILNAGSVMFIPNQVYHIANTGAFSLSIVMDYINPSRDHLEKELAKDICPQDFSHSKTKTYVSPIQVCNENENLGAYLDTESIMSKFRSAFEKRLLRLQSNGGLLNESIKVYKRGMPNGDFKLQGKKVFPIYLSQVNKNTTLIFARGHEIMKNSNSNLQSIISNLNKGEILTFESLKDTLMSEWDITEVYSLVNDLFVIDSIEIIELKSKDYVS